MGDIVADIRARHRRAEWPGTIGDACAGCGWSTPWPCDAARAADEIERLAKRDEYASHIAWSAIEARDVLAARLNAVRALCEDKYSVYTSAVRTALDGPDV